jgi:hypothetical protein
MAGDTPLAELSRGTNSRALLRQIKVFCEGTKTEPGWIQHLRQRHRGVIVSPWTKTERAGTAPISVLKAAADFGKAGQEIWVAFDRDDHDLSRAINDAHAAGYGIVFSNPCFELWPLLHFERTATAALHRAEMERELKTAHPPYDHDKGASLKWTLLDDGSMRAVRQALHLHTCSLDPTTWTGAPGPSAAMTHPTGALANPSTTAWLLHLRCAHPDWFEGKAAIPHDHPVVRAFAKHPHLVALVAFLPKSLRAAFARNLNPGPPPRRVRSPRAG